MKNLIENIFVIVAMCAGGVVIGALLLGEPMIGGISGGLVGLLAGIYMIK